MYHIDYEKTLKLASEIHATFLSQINLKIQDKKLAFYYLQGGSLTQAYVALKNWSYGDLNGIYRVQKFVAETNEVLEFLSLEKDVSRHLKNFFDDGYIQVPNLDKKNNSDLKKKVLEIRGNDEETYKRFESAKKSLNQEFSKGGHPTFYSCAYNTDKYTGVFDYELSNDQFKYYPIRNFDFANFIIIPAAQSVYVFSQLFIVQKELSDKLREAIEHIQNQAIKLHNFRKQNKR